MIKYNGKLFAANWLIGIRTGFIGETGDELGK
jgi:hypothetical protein